MDSHGRSFDSAVNSAADRQPELANGKLPWPPAVRCGGGVALAVETVVSCGACQHVYNCPSCAPSYPLLPSHHDVWDAPRYHAAVIFLVAFSGKCSESHATTATEPKKQFKNDSPAVACSWGSTSSSIAS